MKYILNNDISLHSWTDLPYAYVKKGNRGATKLIKEDFDFLSLCDGKTELEESEPSRKFLLFNIISECKNPESNDPKRACPECDNALPSLNKYRNIKSDNRYFPTASWEITERCNFNCLHCFNAVDNHYIRDEFSYEEACRFIDDAAACGVLDFRITGGEPLLHPHFREIASRIYDRNMRISELLTNGFFLDEDTLGFLKEKDPRMKICISFDGLGHHDWMRQHTGAGEKTLDVISQCVRAGFPVQINMNLNKRNMDSSFPTILAMADMGVERIRILRTTEAPRWEANGKYDTLAFEEYYDLCLDIAGKYKDSGRKAVLVLWMAALLIPFRKSFSCLALQGPSESYKDTLPCCNEAKRRISVSASGNLYPCNAFTGYYDARGIHMGNVKTGNMHELLSKGPYVDCVSQTVRERLNANSECQDCSFYRSCRGGCMALATMAAGDLRRHDPTKCIFLKKGYYERLCRVMDGWKNLLEA